MSINPSESPTSTSRQIARRHARRESLFGLLALTLLILISGALFVLVSQVVAPWSGYPRVVMAGYSILFLTVCAMSCGWDPSTLRRKQ